MKRPETETETQTETVTETQEQTEIKTEAEAEAEAEAAVHAAEAAAAAAQAEVDLLERTQNEINETDRRTHEQCSPDDRPLAFKEIWRAVLPFPICDIAYSAHVQSSVALGPLGRVAVSGTDTGHTHTQTQAHAYAELAMPCTLSVVTTKTLHVMLPK